MNKLILLVAAMAMFSCAIQKKETVAEPARTTETTQATNDITGKRWNLIEINGKAVIPSTTEGNGVKLINNKAFIMLNAEDSRVSASGGCNKMGGSFELKPEVMRIRFSQMASTMMACVNENVDTELARVLETVDNYSLSADGKTLSLNRARMAPLARFEAE
ncbi:MAG: META domain-containing protein [Prevotellaceae bacterium]|jgi:heat shock protein HslJ|nr:META domain-containing protein [Prevotellaceae bacterium]